MNRRPPGLLPSLGFAAKVADNIHPLWGVPEADVAVAAHLSTTYSEYGLLAASAVLPPAEEPRGLHAVGDCDGTVSASGAWGHRSTSC